MKSYHVCNDDVGGYKLNVDITKYNDLWSTRSDNPDVLECYSNVCDCVNVPKYVQEMPKWSLNNHGNNIIAYYESDCSKRMWEPKYIPAGQSGDTMYMANHQMTNSVTKAVYKIQSLGPDPNSTYFQMSCEDSFNYNWIMQLELLETWQDVDSMQKTDSQDMNDPSTVLAQKNDYRIVFFENENFLGTHFESNLTESCKSLPRKTTENNARGLQNEIKSVKTDICVMLFADNECMSRSVKINPSGSSNLTRIWEFTVTGEQTLDLLYDMFPNWKWVTGSFHACTGEEGSSQQLTVDLTSYYTADKEPKANQPAPAIYSRYINVCSCQNIPYQIQVMDKYSIDNHGNSLIAYFQHDCMVTKFDPLWIPAGRSSYSIGFGSFTKIENDGMTVVQKIQSIGPDPNAEYYQNNCVNYEDSDSNMKGLIGDMNTKLQVQNLGNVDVVMGIGDQSNTKSTTKSTLNMGNSNNQMPNKPTSTNNQMLLPPNSNNQMLQQTANSNIQLVQQPPNVNNQMLEARDLNNQMQQKVPSTNIEISQQTPTANIQISQQTPNADNEMLQNPPNNVQEFRPPPNSNQMYPQISRYNKVYSPLPKTKMTPKPLSNQNAINMANQQYRKSNQMYTEPANNGTQILMQQSTKDNKILVESTKDDKQMVLQMAVNNNQGNVAGQQPATGNQILMQSTPIANTVYNQPANQGFQGLGRRFESPAVQPGSPAVDMGGKDSTRNLQKNQMSMLATPNNGLQVLIQPVNENQAAMQPMDGNKVFTHILNGKMFSHAINGTKLLTQPNNVNQMPLQQFNRNQMETQPNNGNQIFSAQSQASNINVNMSSQPSDMGIQMSMQPLSNGNQISGQPVNMQSQMYAPPLDSGTLMTARAMTRNKMHGLSSDSPTTDTSPIEENAPPELQIDNQKDTEMTHTHNQLLTQPSKNSNQMAGQASLQDKQTIMNPTNNNNQMLVQPTQNGNQGFKQPLYTGRNMVGNTYSNPTTKTPPIEENAPPEMQIDSQANNGATHAHNTLLMQSSQSGNQIQGQTSLQDKQTIMNPSNTNQMSSEVNGYGNQVLMQQSNDGNQLAIQPSDTGSQMYTQLTINNSTMFEQTSVQDKPEFMNPSIMAQSNNNANQIPGQSSNNPTLDTLPIEENAPSEIQIDNQKDTEVTHTHNQMLTQPSQNVDQVVGQTTLQDKQTIMNPSNNNQMSTQPSGYGNQMLMQQSSDGNQMIMLPSGVMNPMSLQSSNLSPNMSSQPNVGIQMSVEPSNLNNQMPMQPSYLGNQTPMQQTGTQSSNISVNMSPEPSNTGIQMSVQPSNNETQVPMQASNVNNQIPVQSTINGKGMIMEVTFDDGKGLNDTSDKYKKKARQPFKLTNQMRIQSARNRNRPPPQKRGNWVKLQPPSNGNVMPMQPSKMGKNMPMQSFSRGNQMPMQSPSMGNQMSIKSSDGRQMVMEVSVNNEKGLKDLSNKSNQMPSNAANQMHIQQLDSDNLKFTPTNNNNQMVMQSKANMMSQQPPNRMNLSLSVLPSKVTQLEQQVQQLKQNQDQDEEFEAMAAKIKASLQEVA